MSLSATQQAILALIAEHIDAEGMPPSQTEIAKAFGFKGVRAAQYHLDALEAAGAIERVPGRARGFRLLQVPRLPQQELELVNPGSSMQEVVRLHVLGRVSAGAPIGADSGDTAQVILDRWLFSPVPDYLLKVQGDSMRDEGIFNGDLIGVHRTGDARNGQIVVARVDDEITVKVLKRGTDCVRLLPRNDSYAPIEVRPEQDFAIEGLYCGLVRPNR